MRPESENRLAERFPFFQCNCEVGDGWYGILERLFVKIAVLDLPREFHITRVKEKCGSLRVYIGGFANPILYDEIHALISEAIGESIRTCEVCGQQGMHKGFSTLCEAHRAICYSEK